MPNHAPKVLRCSLACLLTLAASACTTTYTQSDVNAEEQRLNERAKTEIRVDEEIGATGGIADAVTRERLAEEGEWMAEGEID